MCPLKKVISTSTSPIQFIPWPPEMGTGHDCWLGALPPFSKTSLNIGFPSGLSTDLQSDIMDTLARYNTYGIRPISISTKPPTPKEASDSSSFCARSAALRLWFNGAIVQRGIPLSRELKMRVYACSLGSQSFNVGVMIRGTDLVSTSRLRAALLHAYGTLHDSSRLTIDTADTWPNGVTITPGTVNPSSYRAYCGSSAPLLMDTQLALTDESVFTNLGTVPTVTTVELDPRELRKMDAIPYPLAHPPSKTTPLDDGLAALSLFPQTHAGYPPSEETSRAQWAVWQGFNLKIPFKEFQMLHHLAIASSPADVIALFMQFETQCDAKLSPRFCKILSSHPQLATILEELTAKRLMIPITPHSSDCLFIQLIEHNVPIPPVIINQVFKEASSFPDKKFSLTLKGLFSRLRIRLPSPPPISL